MHESWGCGFYTSVYGSLILIGGKSIFYNPFFQAQIISIKRLCNENHTFLSFDELKLKAFVNIPFTLYYDLISAIPAEWKKLLRIIKITVHKQ